jgi:ribonucleoside-triphosphate reductase
MTPYEEFIYLRTYSRFLWEEGRREMWNETNDRFFDFVLKNPLIPEKTTRKIKEKIRILSVAPSMRAMWSAGSAAEMENVAMYNCSFLGINRLAAFGEALYLLMCGTGVGFSVERKHISELPAVPYQKNKPVEKWVVEDSRLGWKAALDKGIETWFAGRDIYYDFSQLRPMGAPLQTMGGRSSGGDVFRQLVTFVREVIMASQGRQLSSLECHDIMCEIASVVVVGGMRRSALISLSDLDDDAIRDCKMPGYHPRRNGSNNSTAYYKKPGDLEFLKEWAALGASGKGERGIANIGGARRNAPHRRKSGLIEGLNPCGEVSLRDKEFCNLTEVIIKSGDDFETVRDNITTATWLGVIQSTFTNFQDLDPAWKSNCEEERLCGVSLTGQMDNPSLLTPEVLKLWKQHAVNMARKAAKILEINTPAAVTCVKPSGTVSKLAGCSSGLHPRWSQYYTQNVQIAKTDPLFKMMVDQGTPHRDTPGSPSIAIIPFPIASPEGAITRHDMSAIDQLEWYSRLVDNFCEHNASCSVYVDDNEWIQVAEWVHRNFESVNGLSFYPKNGNTYEWNPQEEITKEEYEKARDEFPEIDFTKLPDYEKEDNTEGAKTLACSGGSCEL